MARRFTGNTRTASSSAYPQRRPDGRVRGLANPARSNIGLWTYYTTVPEIRAVADRVSSGVARVTFRPCLNIEGETADKAPPLIDREGNPAEGITPQMAEQCAEVWARVKAPSGNQSDLFASLATAYTVASDAWQFGYPGTPDMYWDPFGTPMWVGVARDALVETSEQYLASVGLEYPVKVPKDPDVDGHGTAIRIWNQNPQAPAQADSWLASCARSVQILSAIYEAVAAVALSRMNAGLIIAPDDQDQLPIPSSALVNQGQTDLYPLGANLQQALYDEIGDHVEASAQELDGMARAVPAVIGVNSTIADKVKWLELARNMDPELGKRIDDLRYRIAVAAPTPPEIILGLGQTNHWNGQQIDQSEYQRTILPVCEKIAQANTAHVLRTTLIDEYQWSQSQADRVQIGFSAKALLMPPDRSDSAIKVAALPSPIPALSDSELREATGLGDFDGPDEDEAKMHAVLALASANPAYGYLLPLVGLPAPEVPTATDPTEVIDTNSTVMLPARTAAALPTEDVGGELVAVATRYESDITVLFGAVIDRMAERASSRVASLARGSKWADLRHTIRDTDPAMFGVIPGVLPKLASEGVDDGDLFEPALAAFSARFATLTTAAQKRAVRTAGADWSDFETDADEANAAAWALAGRLLIQEARYRFEGRLPEDDAEASVDPFGIPSGIIRRTSAVAGGDLDVASGADPDRLSTSNLGTIATAALAVRALQVAARTIVGWEFDYRPELARRTYEEHLDLHGTFEPGEQPGDFGGFYPGDHRGCLCCLRPVTGLGQVGEGVEFG